MVAEVAPELELADEQLAFEPPPPGGESKEEIDA